MIRKTFLLALCTSALLASQATAQIIIPALPLNPRVKQPKVDGLQDLQKQLEGAFEQAGGKLGGVNDGSMRWGGVRLTAPSADLRAQLGLEEKEGLVVAGVDASSAADKAGLKANDVLVKINGKTVPSDLEGFGKLLKDAKVDESAEMVVVRMGKEETLKGAKMPAIAQAPMGGGKGGMGRIGIAGAFGGLNQRILINQRAAGGQVIKNINMELADGTKIIRKQDAQKFSGEYAKDELKITIAGTMDKGRPTPGEVTVTEGKETKKYTTLAEVPAQHQVLIRRYLLPGSPINNLNMTPALPNFPGLPLLP